MNLTPAVVTLIDLALEEDLGRGDVIAELTGPAQPMLAAERTMLNFLQRLSGVATQSRRYADAVRGTRTRVVDTRKTTPGWRALEKRAVLAGGCGNHRADLGSGVLIKDNHVAACGGVGKAVTRARAHAPHTLRIEVEVKTRAELEEALEAKADVVMLDNWPPEDLAAAVARCHQGGALVEVSGGVTFERLAEIAAAGADLVSVGALTHSARAVDISLDFTPR
jgi:nicotinate-nucleotide pyrophosphorylase (carboxylating)